jgi:hypothetical protein
LAQKAAKTAFIGGEPKPIRASLGLEEFNKSTCLPMVENTHVSTI